MLFCSEGSIAFAINLLISSSSVRFEEVVVFQLLVCLEGFCVVCCCEFGNCVFVGVVLPVDVLVESLCCVDPELVFVLLSSVGRIWGESQFSCIFSLPSKFGV